jgi:hypothetical protein
VLDQNVLRPTCGNGVPDFVPALQPPSDPATWPFGWSITLGSRQPPGLFVRHRLFFGELQGINPTNQLDRQDATFILRPGLNGANDTVSFESVNFPGFFLRHSGNRLKLMENDNSPNFSRDASYFRRAPLAGGEKSVSFESGSATFSEFYIRHRQFHVFFEHNDGSDLFKNDATFQARLGLISSFTDAAH